MFGLAVNPHSRAYVRISCVLVCVRGEGVRVCVRGEACVCVERERGACVSERRGVAAGNSRPKTRSPESGVRTGSHTR